MLALPAFETVAQKPAPPVLVKEAVAEKEKVPEPQSWAAKAVPKPEQKAELKKQWCFASAA